jgi:hypothetical protein
VELTDDSRRLWSALNCIAQADHLIDAVCLHILLYRFKG